MTITKSTRITDIAEKHPKAAEILMEKYGMHCIGCYAAAFETVEEGAKAHGMSKKEIDDMVEELNKVLK